MNKKRSLFQAILLRIHYKTSLALVSVFLGALAFSGFYFFGQNIVNEADEQQRIARIQLSQERDTDRVIDTDSSVTPTAVQESENEESRSIGGVMTTTAPSPTVTTSTPVTPTVSPSATPSASVAPVPPLNAAKFVIGDPNAEKSIIAYYDFECVACARFIEDVFPVLKAEYLDTGKAKMIFKNFPLSNHPLAPLAHNAAMCASVKGSFWEYHDILFANQSEWSGTSTTEATTLMKAYFKELGVTDTQFDACVDNNTYKSYLDEDKQLGKDSGVSKVPTFIIGDEKIEGGKIETLRSVLDAE